MENPEKTKPFFIWIAPELHYSPKNCTKIIVDKDDDVDDIIYKIYNKFFGNILITVDIHSRIIKFTDFYLICSNPVSNRYIPNKDEKIIDLVEKYGNSIKSPWFFQKS